MGLGALPCIPGVISPPLLTPGASPAGAPLEAFPPGWGPACCRDTMQEAGRFLRYLVGRKVEGQALGAQVRGWE